LENPNIMHFGNNLPERVKVSVRLRPFIDEEINCKDRSVAVEHLDIEKGIIVIKKDFEKR
jgi:kinesin family protein 5/centromeric protein E